MKKVFFISFITYSSSFFAQQWKTDEQYIQRFAGYAVEEMEKYKIPASIKLAQGLLETGGGQSRLAQEGKNHFGIKCKEEWTGKTMKHTDDAPNECFRVYEDPRESYRDHSLFLANRKYYTGLFKLDIKDYKAWAHGLKKAGYATNPRYAYILIDKIEKYKLYEFDNVGKDQVYAKLTEMYPDFQSEEKNVALASVSKTSNKSEEPTKIHKTASVQQDDILVSNNKSSIKAVSINAILNQVAIKNHPNGKMKYFVVPADGITVAEISKRFGVAQADLLKFNDLNSDSELRKNQIVFLDAKKTYARQKTYKVEEGETMHDVSQKFGIRLRNLYANNRMYPGQEPKTGEIVYVSSRKPRS